MITEQEKTEFEAALRKEQARLERILKSIAVRDPENKENWNPSFPKMSDDKGRASSTMEESADEVEEFETRTEDEGTLNDRYRDVLKAIEKIADGSYGICEKCGKEIPLDRLRANPAALTDIEHSE